MSDELVKLTNVRLSFPDIWKAKAMQEGSEPKFSAALLLDKTEHADLIKHVRRVIWNLAQEKLGDSAKKVVQDSKRICLHEGADKTYDGYNAGNMYLSASSTKRPSVVDRDLTTLVEADGRPYAGCYVNAAVRFWVQDNNFGKRINCELRGLQFVRDGEPFGAPPFVPEDVFQPLDEPRQPGVTGPVSGMTGMKGVEGAPAPSDDDNEIPF